MYLEDMRSPSFYIWLEEAHSSVQSANWTGHDITTVGQCSWLVLGKGEHIHPSVKSTGHPDNLCQHLPFDFCSTFTFYFLSEIQNLTVTNGVTNYNTILVLSFFIRPFSLKQQHFCKLCNLYAQSVRLKNITTCS